MAEQQEIVDFVNGFSDRAMELNIQTKPISLKAKSQESRQEGMVDLPAIPDREVMEYIKSKPNFAHNLFEVQERFFGRRFTSRGNTKRMYHRTARQLRLIRPKIERQHKGKFEEEISEHGVKQFIFKKPQAIEFLH